MRYSIEAIQYGSENWVEVCQVENNPEDIVDGLKNKSLKMKDLKGHTYLVSKYSRVRIIDTSDDV
jgi:hypothetical protein